MAYLNADCDPKIVAVGEVWSPFSLVNATYHSKIRDEIKLPDVYKIEIADIVQNEGGLHIGSTRDKRTIVIPVCIETDDIDLQLTFLTNLRTALTGATGSGLFYFYLLYNTGTGNYWGFQRCKVANIDHGIAINQYNRLGKYINVDITLLTDSPTPYTSAPAGAGTSTLTIEGVNVIIKIATGGGFTICEDTNTNIVCKVDTDGILQTAEVHELHGDTIV